MTHEMTEEEYKDRVKTLFFGLKKFLLEGVKDLETDAKWLIIGRALNCMMASHYMIVFQKTEEILSQEEREKIKKAVL